jgi:prephenate dehydrogenase
MAEARRANVVGLGLIGGSVGRALRARGWRVHGTDVDAARAADAAARGVVDGTGIDPEAEITFVAVPALAVADAVKDALAPPAASSPT